MKSFLDVLELTGLSVPAWIFIIVLVGMAIYGVVKLFQKIIIPKVEKYLRIREDINSISEIKSTQREAIKKSIEGDEILNKRIDTMNDKLDAIVNVLESLNDYTKVQKVANESTQEGLKMILASELDKKYRRYLELGYIPDSEFDEYCNMFHTYHDSLGGNGTGKIKFDYIMEHLERKI